jgi:hypothetical protein
VRAADGGRTRIGRCGIELRRYLGHQIGIMLTLSLHLGARQADLCHILLDALGGRLFGAQRRVYRRVHRRHNDVGINGRALFMHIHRREEFCSHPGADNFFINRLVDHLPDIVTPVELIFSTRWFTCRPARYHSVHRYDSFPIRE